MDNLDIGIIQHWVSKIELVYKDFTVFTKANPVVGGMLGLYVMGVVTFFFKTIPLRVYRSIKNFLTVETTLTSNKKSFYLFLRWFENQNFKFKYTRSFSIDNGRWGHDKSLETIGYGTHYFYHKGRIFRIIRTLKDSQNTDFKETIEISTLGFTTKSVKRIIDESQKRVKKNKKEPIYNYLFTLSEGWQVKNTLRS